MTDDEIQELILAFLDTRGGYVAGASERELFLMVKQAVLAERERCAAVAESFMPSGFRDGSLDRHEGQTYHKLPLGDLIGIARDDRARVIAYALRSSSPADVPRVEDADG